MSRIAGRISGSRIVGAPVLNIPGLTVVPAKLMGGASSVFTVTVDDSDGHVTTGVQLYNGLVLIHAATDQGGGVWSYTGAVATGLYSVRARRLTAEGVAYSKAVRLKAFDPLLVSIAEKVALVPNVGGGKLELRQGTTLIARVTLPATAFNGPVSGVYTARGGDGSTAISSGNPLVLTVVADGVIDNYRVLNSSSVQQWTGTVGETGSGADVEVADAEMFSGMTAKVVAWTHDTNP